MMIQYQNNRTGASFDVTSLVVSAKWTTTRSGSPAKLELSALKDAAVEWTEGGIITLQDGESGLFYGYVFKISLSQDETVDITAYDQTRYLKNKETYVFQGVRADQVLREIAEDFKLKAGDVPNTGYLISYMIFDSKPLFDIILEALDRTLINSGRMFYLWDDFGALRLSEVTRPAELPVIGEDSLSTGFTYTSSIDGETYNQIKLVRDNKDTGKRDVYIVKDSNNMALWGTLQAYEKADDGLNEGQIKAQAEQMLELYNRPERTLSLSALALPGLRAGQIIYARLPAAGVEQSFLVEEVTHDLLEEDMELKVRVV
ncbi:conserved hypothetical protein [uncultured Eubacteriales bacterium]|uniref:YqbQ/XkdQ domain-containing protein n=1 Tax=uncultured Eubacteriales bacterium TaxID=172733 RepID=A0A212J4M4_9FIRM|nr:conserved hypothetical protein [uncultured Eubacteriales bacterium]